VVTKASSFPDLRVAIVAGRAGIHATIRALREALELYRAIGATGHAERLARKFGA
jgi:hypothetical protein